MKITYNASGEQTSAEDTGFEVRRVAIARAGVKNITSSEIAALAPTEKDRNDALSAVVRAADDATKKTALAELDRIEAEAARLEAVREAAIKEIEAAEDPAKIDVAALVEKQNKAIKTPPGQAK